VSAEPLLLLGEALGGRGDPLGAREAYLAAAQLARDTEDAYALARAALGYGASLSGFEVDLFDARQQLLLQEALDRLPAEDSAERSWVLGRLSVAVSFSADAPQRREMAEAAWPWLAGSRTPRPWPERSPPGATACPARTTRRPASRLPSRWRARPARR
jgi:hypothetical protein